MHLFFSNYESNQFRCNFGLAFSVFPKMQHLNKASFVLARCDGASVATRISDTDQPTELSDSTL